MKRHLASKQRQGVHGEFGIGLLGFWSLGEELRMVSRGQDGRLWEMKLKRGESRYSIDRPRGVLTVQGTIVIVGPIHETSRKLVTGEKLARYINSGHRDFLASRSSSTKHRRYIGRLYAKEMVLLNFPHESQGEVMERLVELLLRTEDTL